MRPAVVGAGLVALMGILLASTPQSLEGQTIRGENAYPWIQIKGRLQPQFYYADNGPYSATVGPTNQIFLRRARFRIRVGLTDNLSVLLNPAFEGTPATVRIRDAYVDLRLSGKESGTYILLRTGQLKRRFGRYENKSSTNLPSLERGRGLGLLSTTSNDLFKNAGFMDRDVGAVLFIQNTTNAGHAGFGKTVDGETPDHGWGFSVSMFNGQGASAADVNNSKSFGARGTYRISRQLDLGAAVFLHDGIVGADSSFTNVAYGLEAEWGKIATPGLWVDLETMYGQAFSANKPWMFGVSLVGAYHIRLDEDSRFWAIEPAAQIDVGDPDVDVDSDASWLVRVGANAYLNPTTQLRLMLEQQMFNAANDPSIFGIRIGLTVSW
jgi:hypothetical protein